MADLNLLQLEDLELHIVDEEYALVGKAITEWSSLFSDLLGIFAKASGLELPVAAMVAGTMDVRGLYSRVMAIMAFKAGLPKPLKTKKTSAKLAELQMRRNELAHGHLVGKNKHTGELLFMLKDFVPQDNVPIIRVAAYSTDRLRWVQAEIWDLAKSLRTLPSVHDDEDE